MNTPGGTELTLHLVRHGQSEWNLQGRLQGQTAHPTLTPLGHEQAAAAAAWLSTRPVDSVLSSDLVRAVQTAAPIAAAHGLTAVTERRLREQGMGRLEGLSSAAAFDATAGADWSDPKIRLGGTDSESSWDVQQRVGTLIAELLLGGPGTVVLVSHGDAIRIAAGWLAATTDAPERFEADQLAVANGSIITARLSAGVLQTLATTVVGPG